MKKKFITLHPLLTKVQVKANGPIAQLVRAPDS